MRFDAWNLVLTVCCAVCLAGCSFGRAVSLQQKTPAVKTSLLPDGPYQSFDTLYFRVISDSEIAMRVGEIANKIYQTILGDLKLTDSYRPYSLIGLYLYKTREEYLAKTGMPQWSDGVFMRDGLALYEHPRLGETLAHEISHMIFGEFFGRARPDLLWLNEGLAMFEESRAKGDKRNEAYKAALPILKGYYTPLTALTATPSAFDLGHTDREVKIFYVESWLLVKFLLEQGGRVGFSEMLKNLKAGKTLDEALALGFPGKWANLAQLETSFKAEYSLLW